MRLMMKSILMFMALFVITSVCHATTWVVGPNSTTPAPPLPYSAEVGDQTMDICAAITAAASGDTVEVDYNNGIPYKMTPWHNGGAAGTVDCWININNLTVIGFNGRPIIDLNGMGIYKAPFDITSGNGGATGGQNIIFTNFEVRGAASSHESSTSAFRIESGSTAAPAGGNTTIQYCYIHDNGGDGVLTNSVGTFDGNAYGVANPYVTLLNDEIADNGYGDYGYQHNMYIGADQSGQAVFNMYYTWTHDAVAGHTVKTRTPNNNIYYNLIGDAAGQTNSLIDMPFGGSTYIVGNSFYRVTTNQNNNSGNVIIYGYDDAQPGPYGPPAQSNAPYNYQDLHVVNNSFLIDPTYNTVAYVAENCNQIPASSCPTPASQGGYGAQITVAAVIENNIFIGPASLPLTNQEGDSAPENNTYESNNIQLTNNGSGTYTTMAQLAAGSNVTTMFNDAAHYDFHLVSGASAIAAGLTTPTLNDGVTADSKAKAVSEFLIPDNYVARPNVKDAGAYSYPRAGSVPTLNLVCTSAVTTPGTGTFTVTGLPTPAGGQYNTVTFESENIAQIPDASATSTTGTVTGQFTAIAPTNGSPSVVDIPIDVYADGEHLTCTVAVTPGPPTLVSITNDNGNGSGFSQTSVNLLNPPTTSTGPLTVTLSTSNSTVLSVPSSTTVPVGSYSAETGSETGSLWGQSPSSQSATLTATLGSTQVTLPVQVNAPIISGYCNMYPCTVVGGQQANILVDSFYSWPLSGANITFTSSNSAVIPNYNVTLPGPGFYTNVLVPTNPVTSTVTVNTLTATANGSSAGYGPVTVIPGVGVPVTITVVSGSGQSAAVDTNFANPLVVVVKDSNGTGVSGVTVNFTGSGLNFPNGTTATTGSNGQASIVAQPAQASSLTLSANYLTSAGYIGSVPANFTETGTTTTPTSIVATSGSGQTAPLNLAFAYPLVVTVTGAGSVPVLGGVVTFTGTGVSFPNGNVAVTNASGQVSVVAVPTSSGSLTVTAAVSGLGSTATFSETGTTAEPSTLAIVSGNNQSAILGQPFTNPLVVVVKSSGGTGVPGVVVNFSGTGVSYTSSTFAVTNASGQAQITAVPDNPGALTITATVSGIQPVLFSETGTQSGVYLQSVIETPACCTDAGITVNLSGNAPAGGIVVTLVSSNPSVLYVPSPVTIASGTSSLAVNSLLGSAWGQSPASQVATVTATYNGVQQILTSSHYTTQIHDSINCNSNPCTGVGGTAVGFNFETAFNSTPETGAVVTVTSDTPAVIPNQTDPLPIGSSGPSFSVNTNSGQPTTTVNLTFNYNGIVNGPYAVQVTSGTSVSTTTNLTTSPNPSASGASVLFTATVTPTSGTATGSVQFSVNGSAVGSPVGLNGSGVATYSTTTLAVGTSSISATYIPTGSFSASTSNTVSQVVNGASCGTLSSVTLDQATEDPTSVNFTAATTCAAVVTLSSSNSSVLWVPASVTVPQGAATAETGSLLGSAWGQSPASQNVTITATYNSVQKQLTTAINTLQIHSWACQDSPCTVTGGSTVPFLIESAFGAAPVGGLLIPITSNYPAIIPNQSVTQPAGNGYFGFNVNTNSGQPTENVTVTITYNGIVGTFPVTVNGSTVSTTTTLASSLNPSTYGTNVTYTATVSPSAATGTVTFYNGGSSIGTGTLSGGVATLTTATLPVGTDSITATYGGATGYATSTSSAVSQVVNIATTTTALASSLNPSTYGASVKFTATVTPSAATGTVTFKSGTTTLGTGTLSGGVATYTTTTLPLGTSSITAVYGGSTDYGTSTSSAVSQVVNKATTTTALASSLNPSTYGASVKFTATVTPSAATGTVTFKSGTTTLGTGTLSGGVATYTTTTLPVGTSSITAVYGGSTDYSTSTSSAVSQVVNKATTTLSLVSSLNPSLTGQSVKFTATITPAAATGTITFKNGSTTLGTGTLSSGVATYTTTTLPVGTDSITASYATTTDYAASTSNTVSQVVTASCGTLSSVTLDSGSYVTTSVNFTAATTCAATVTLTSSNTAAIYIPASVTVPQGATTAETGSLLGSLWGQSPSSQVSTITATYNAVPKTLAVTAYTPALITVEGNATYTGAGSYYVLGETNWSPAPVGGGPITVTSSNTAAIPNQTLTIAAGQSNCGSGCYLTVNSVATSTNVTVTYTYNGSQQVVTDTVNP